jgi:hypothetical protein
VQQQRRRRVDGSERSGKHRGERGGQRRGAKRGGEY